MMGTLDRYLARRLVPGANLVGVGSGVLLGLAVAEIAGPGISAGWLFLAAGAVGLDRFLRGRLRPVVGVLGALGLAYRFLEGHWCAEFEAQPTLGGPVVALAGFGWLVAVVVGSGRRKPWFGIGFNSLLLLFGLVKLGAFMASPAGLPLAALLPVPTLGIVAVCALTVGIWAGLDPAGAEEGVGWIMALALVFLAAQLSSTPIGNCGAEAAWAVAAGFVGGMAAYVMSRFVPIA